MYLILFLCIVIALFLILLSEYRYFTQSPVINFQGFIHDEQF